jgi:hypothetical protein
MQKHVLATLRAVWIEAAEFAQNRLACFSACRSGLTEVALPTIDIIAQEGSATRNPALYGADRATDNLRSFFIGKATGAYKDQGFPLLGR